MISVLAKNSADLLCRLILHTQLLLTIVLLPVVTLVRSDFSPAYLHDPDIGIDHSNWMGTLDDSVELLDLSLPGTHDTMAFYGGDIAHTQTLPLPIQLRAGIRVLDIRCRHIDDKFAIHHGRVFQHAWFNNVLDEVVEFLARYPSEVVLMRVSKNYNDHNNTRSFTDTFIYYQSMPEYSAYFWYPSKSESGADAQGDYTRLQLEEIRGKIVVLDDFSKELSAAKNQSHAESPFGLNYKADFNTQDAYVLKTNWDLYSKWSKVKSHLIAANASTGSSDPPRTKAQIYMNYLSGSTGVFPFFVASGHVTHGTRAHRLPTGFTQPPWSHSKWPDFPRVDCALHVCTILFEGTNTLTYGYITDNKEQQLNYVGFIMADFPGPGLVEAIIALNYKKSLREGSRLRRQHSSLDIWMDILFYYLKLINTAGFVVLMTFACIAIIYWRSAKAQLTPKVIQLSKYEVV